MYLYIHTHTNMNTFTYKNTYPYPNTYRYRYTHSRGERRLEDIRVALVEPHHNGPHSRSKDGIDLRVID